MQRSVSRLDIAFAHWSEWMACRTEEEAPGHPAIRRPYVPALVSEWVRHVDSILYQRDHPPTKECLE